MSENTRHLMGDPPPGRTQWSPPAAIQAPTHIRTGYSRPVAEAGNPVTEQTQEVEAQGYPYDTDTLRPIQAIEIDTTLISPVPTGEPIFERVDPKTLLVDEAYQRDLSPKSMDLITRIAARWDWRRFKPPVVAFADGGLQVIDGQHTAIGAATRGIPAIPVMIVEAAALEDRAKAFIGHNRDRLQVSTMQIHHAAVAAGDVEAAAIEGVCAEAGVALVRSPYGSYKYKVGETIAVTAIGDLIRDHGVKRARELLKVLVAADLAPIKRDHIKAVDHLFSDIDYSSNLDPLPEGGEDVAQAIMNLGDQGIKDARVFAASHQVPLWKGIAAVWFKKSRKRRKAV